MTTAVIDGDLICYRCAASAENDEQDIALVRASRLLSDIISVTDASEIKLFLSGSRNFRYDLYPEYKANRKDMKRPKHLQPLREYLVVAWGAEVTDGYEADDAIGMEMGEGKVCCSLDKDLLQIPGSHFNFVTQEFQEISEIEGYRNFYTQLVLGDRADNVPGYDGKMRPKWPKFLGEIRERLSGANTPEDMYRVVQGLYEDQQALIRNGNLLYLWRKMDDSWQPQTAAVTMSEEKQETELKSASMQTTQEGTTQSTERGTMQQKPDGFLTHGRWTDVLLGQKLPEGST